MRDDVGDAGLAREVRRAIAQSLWRMRALVRDHQDEETPPLPARGAAPLDRLRQCADELGRRATALLADQQSDERKALRAECDELAARGWLASVRDDVIAEIGRRKSIAALKAAARDCATNRVTTKSTEIAEGLVTRTLRSEFAKEVGRLGVARLSIELQQERTAQGVPLFRVSLINKPDAKVGDVLSEGEHRCVALAAFLAELATADLHSAIVFDDPVSSLDHVHREKVAARLAEEAGRRQVVVFTHDIAFLFLLHEECRGRGQAIAVRSVNRGTDAAGYCSGEAPPYAQPVRNLIGSMRKQLANRRIHHERGNTIEWAMTVSALQDQLRKGWERVVEEALSPVVKRLSNKVDTKNLAKLTVLTVDDCRTMRNGFGRCSALLHSSAEALNQPLPEPGMIEAEIDALQAWLDDVKQRQDAATAAT